MITKILDRGTLNIAEEVIALIASTSIKEVEGVVGTVSGIRDEIARVVSKNGNQRGVIVKNDDEKVSIHMKIAVYYGAPIQACSLKLQEKVKHDIEKMTGIDVQCVDISIEHIVVQDEPIDE
jgi:uncharacterized alkaline shock family protein YloU